MRLLISTTLIGILITLSWAAATFSPEAKKAKYLQLGQTYFDRGNTGEALIEFKNVVQLDPKNADTHYRLALTYLKLGGRQIFRCIQRTEPNSGAGQDEPRRPAQAGALYLLANEPAKARKQADMSWCRTTKY